MNPNNISSNEKEILRFISEGDEEAFLELYNLYSVGVYNYIFRLVNERESAEDLLQEVFLALWNGAHAFKGNSSVKTWLFKIAHNQVVSWWRKKSKLEEYNDEIPSKTGVNPEGIYLDSWRREVLITALSQLSPVHKAVIVLTFYHGFSYNEISEIMNCPVGTVKSRMSYARKYFFFKLGEMQPDMLPVHGDLT